MTQLKQDSKSYYVDRQAALKNAGFDYYFWFCGEESKEKQIFQMYICLFLSGRYISPDYFNLPLIMILAPMELSNVSTNTELSRQIKS